MPHPNAPEWPIWHGDRGHDQKPRAVIAPLRHDIALARYLEKQAAHRASPALIDVSTAAVQAGRMVLSGVRYSIVLANTAIDFLNDIGMTLARACLKFSAPRKRH